MTRLQTRNELDSDAFFALRAGSGGPAVIVCPDYGGSVMYARPLVAHLPADVAAFGVRVPGSLVAELRSMTLADLGRRLADRVAAAPPHAGVHLIGHSFGGFLAFETAVALERRGVRVGLVGLLDPVLQLRPDVGSRAWWMNIARRGWRLLRRRSPDRERRAAGPNSEVPSLSERAYTPAHADLLTSLKGMLETYRPSDLSGDATLFRARRSHLAPDLGWSRHVHGTLRIVPVEGDHLGMIRDPAHARTLAVAVGAEVLRIEAQRGSTVEGVTC